MCPWSYCQLAIAAAEALDPILGTYLADITILKYDYAAILPSARVPLNVPGS